MDFNHYFNGAKYVESSTDFLFPYIRKNFNLEKDVQKAELTVSVLGFGELYLNGKKVTDDLYITPHAMYNPQLPQEFYINPRACDDPYFNDELGYSVYVSKFDATEFLVKGKNVFAALVSGGWYYTGPDKYQNYRNFGKPKIAFRLKVCYVDGKTEEIVSDGSEKWAESFLVAGGIFHEEQDENKEIKDFASLSYDDKDWAAVKTTEPYPSKYILNECPPNRIIKWLTPELVRKTDTEKIYKTPINVTGFPVIKNGGKSGETITVWYGEELDEEGNLDLFHCYEQNSVFITDGRKEHGLRMTWHGFRFFSVKTTGDINDISCEKVALVYADVKNTSFFRCNDQTLNFIYDAYVLTQLENYQCGVPCDCPQIERKGYTGDGQVLCELGMSLFDSRKLYRKWLNDIKDVQDKKTGFVHNTAPVFVSCGGGPGGWSVAIVNVPYAYYKYFGDKEILKEFYPQMVKYTEFMADESVDGLITIHKRKAHCLGDWNGPVKPFLPEPFANTCMYIEALYRMIEIAAIIGENQDIEKYEKTIEELKAAVDKNYLDKETGDYCGNEKGSNAFALNVGLGDERTLNNLVKRYAEYKGFDTGIFGTKYLPKVLFERGYDDVATSLYTSNNEFSYKAWKDAGETTMLEAWKGARSHNHPMFGSSVLWMFEYMLGIRQKKGSAAFSDIVINPHEIKTLTEISGGIKTVKGEISVSYKKTADGVDFAVKVPSKAEFVYKGYKATLNAGENKFTVKE